MNDKLTDFSTTLNCPIFAECGGCTRNVDLDKPDLKSEITAFFAPLPFHFFTDRFTNWRVKARLAVRGKAGAPQIGLFAKGSHHVVDMPICPLQLENLNKSLRIARNLIRESDVCPYDETRLCGDLRYLQLWLDHPTQKAQLTLVATQKSPSIRKLANMIESSGAFHSLWLNYQSDTGNRIFGNEYEILFGESCVVQKILDCDFFFHPATFTQAHLFLFEKLLLSIRSHLLPHSRVVEYYAGVGVIGLSLSDLCQSLDCVENNPYAEPCFQKHARPTEARYHTAAAIERLDLIENADVIIVDPPRKGLDKELLEALCADNGVQQLFYVSCHFPSFKRDCERLKESGWQVLRAEGYLLFPGTEHIEVLAEFRR